METLKLSCSIKEFDTLHSDVDKVRKNSKTVRVNKDILIKLLHDHSEMHNKLLSFNVNITEDTGYEN